MNATLIHGPSGTAWNLPVRSDRREVRNAYRALRSTGMERYEAHWLIMRLLLAGTAVKDANPS